MPSFLFSEHAAQSEERNFLDLFAGGFKFRMPVVRSPRFEFGQD
jgi:hypothetical protein